jgi:hypothetical protein
MGSTVTDQTPTAPRPVITVTHSSHLSSRPTTNLPGSRRWFSNVICQADRAVDQPKILDNVPLAIHRTFLARGSTGKAPVQTAENDVRSVLGGARWRQSRRGGGQRRRVALEARGTPRAAMTLRRVSIGRVL